nr:unnamed protein product [Callosobruchus chinensis]
MDCLVVYLLRLLVVAYLSSASTNFP